VNTRPAAGHFGKLRVGDDVQILRSVAGASG
jgi:hypothetical protein